MVKKNRGEKMNDAQKLAEEHWAFTNEIMRIIYKRAFVQGYGHGKETRPR